MSDTDRNPIIVALDVESATEARALVNALGPRAGFYKVGLELYSAAGPEFVRELLGQGKRVFLDLKLYDIGETVKRAVAQVARLGVHFLTVHAQGQVMRAAVEGRGESQLKLLGVTVLTSFDQQDLENDGYSLTVADLVKLRVERAIEAGVDGIVASPLEVANIRWLTGPSKTLVIPGVRSAWASKGDQKRVATPGEALRNGADYLVMGRQITRAADPAAEMARVLEEIEVRA
jgi:orotidine-5'-phosphate decarboxylase